MIPFDGVKLVSFELSNICPHARFHKTCPCSLPYEPAHLESEIVLRTFDELGAAGWVGGVMLSIYNEPMADPRFFWLLEEMRRRVPGATLRLWTSSYWTTEEMLKELLRHGVSEVGVNFYGEKQQQRQVAPPPGMKMEWRGGQHDDRLDLYSREPTHRGSSDCGLPSREVVIWHTGRVGLCCLEWGRSVIWGDLHTQTLGHVLAGEPRQEFLRRAEEEGRHLPPCVRCGQGLKG